jgi:hypothetical protein
VEIQRRVFGMAREAKIRGKDYEALIAEGLSRTIDAFLDDHILSIEEEAGILRLAEAFHIDLEAHPTLKPRLVKGAILRDIVEGLPSSRVEVDGRLPFLLAKDERIVWLFANCDYYEMRRNSHFVAGSHGVSVRLMRGVYYRVGATRGKTITTEDFAIVDKGAFAITNKHIFFSGSSKSFRVRLNKLVSCECTSDGIIFRKDGANPKPQGVGVDDPWFAANLISHLQ